jgi:hypothetical protein
LTQKGISDAQLQLYLEETDQNLDAENLGCNTIVPPAQSVDSIEYDWAFV